MDKESEKQFMKSAVKIINELKLTLEEIEKYEDCEIISDLLDDENVKSIDDETLRKILIKMRDLHSEVRRNNYAAYTNMAKSLFEEIPNKTYILKYHTLEGLSNKISDNEIKQIKEKNIQNIIVKVKHIHDNIAEKKANVIRQIKIY